MPYLRNMTRQSKLEFCMQINMRMVPALSFERSLVFVEKEGSEIREI